MLILTRKTQETIKMGNDIPITVASINGNQIRIGTEAPMTVTILREELTEADKPGY
jgi:carbon storage regulator